MSENETPETVTEAPRENSPIVKETPSRKSSVKGYVISGLIVILIIFGVLYLLEKEGRSSTNIFGEIIASQEAKRIVATVNGEDITNSELELSIQQFSQSAVAQGVDLTNPQALTEIRNQALDVLVNTKLLMQEAAEKNIVVTDDDVAQRLEEIKTDMGGEEVLAERMLELGIEADQLQKDVRDELVIQGLLDLIFAEAEIEVTEEEIIEVYEGAGGVEAGLPPLDEVREQIEGQVKSSKEQVAIDEYLSELKAKGEIVLLEQTQVGEVLQEPVVYEEVKKVAESE